MRERRVWIIDQMKGQDHFQWEIFESESERGYMEIRLKEVDYEVGIFVVGMKCTKEEAENWIWSHYGQEYIGYYRDNYMD